MFCLRDENKKIKTILYITCSLFFLICIISIFAYGNSTLLGSLSKPDNDDVKFIRSGWILSQTGRYYYHHIGTDTVFMMPGLPYSLAFFMLIFGKMGGITAYRIFQAVFQTGSIFLVFFIARKIFNSKIAVVAVIINALCIADYWVTNLILTESMFKFFVLSLVYFSIYAIEENKVRYYIFGGIAWGFATLFRPTISLYPIIILIMWIFKKYSLKNILKNTIIVSAIFCLILSPWWVRNYNIFHKFIPLTKAEGNPMLQGTYINYDQSTKKTDGLNYSQFKYKDGKEEIYNNSVDVKVSKYRVEKLGKKHPFKYIFWYTFGKTFYQIRWPFIWIEFLGVQYWMAGLWHYLILGFGLIGIVKFFKNKDRNMMGILVFSMIIYFIVVYLPFYAFERYFYPAIPYVIMFASYGLISLIENKLAIKKGIVG